MNLHGLHRLENYLNLEGTRVRCETRFLDLNLSHHLWPYYVCVSSEGSGETM